MVRQPLKDATDKYFKVYDTSQAPVVESRSTVEAQRLEIADPFQGLLEVISPDRSSIPVEWLVDKNEIPSGEYFVTWDPEQNRLDLISDDGERTQVLQLPRDESSFSSQYSPIPIEGSGPVLVFTYSEDVEIDELLIWETSFEESLAAKLLCSQTINGRDVRVHTDMVAIRCRKTPSAWNLFDPSGDRPNKQILLDRSMMGMEDFQLRSISLQNRLWVFDQRRFFNNGGLYPICIQDETVSDLFCHELPYWIGSPSPDGLWIETRKGDAYNAEAVGSLAIDCLLHETPTCDPTWLAVDLPDNTQSHLDAAWTSDSRHIIFVGTPFRIGDPTSIWQLDRQNLELEFLAAFDGVYRIRALGDFAPLWTMDGTQLLLEEFGSQEPDTQFVLFSLEDGSLTEIGRGGVIYGRLQVP